MKRDSRLPLRGSSQQQSILKIVTLIVLLAPAIWMLLAFQLDWFGAKPFERLIEEAGSFAIRFLLLSLAISPARSILRWPSLISIRRRVGLASFFYGIAHLCLFALDRELGPLHLASEIFRYPVLLIGFATLISLLPLAVTSSDPMIKRLGPHRWRLLHRSVYVIAALGLLHFILESPNASIEPLVLGGCFFWLMAYRLWRWRASLGLPAILVIGMASTAATALAEALFLSLKLGAPLTGILVANLGVATGLRPAQLVLCLAITVLIAAMIRAIGTRPARRRPTRATSAA
ncbi:MAG: sulfite oxidase heme-binding subunit YedZ [Geminicoccales bacterium]